MAHISAATFIRHRIDCRTVWIPYRSPSSLDNRPAYRFLSPLIFLIMWSPSSLHHHTFISIHFHHSLLPLLLDIIMKSRSTNHCMGTPHQSPHLRPFSHPLSILTASLLHAQRLLSFSFSILFQSIFSPCHPTVPPLKKDRRSPPTALKHSLKISRWWPRTAL